MVHSGFCGGLRAGFHLRLPSRRMALWFGRSHLVGGRGTALGAGCAFEVIPENRPLHPALAAAKFFEHLGINVSPADDSHV